MSSMSPLDMSFTSTSGYSSIYTLKVCIINGFDFHQLEASLKNLDADITSTEIWISYSFLGVTTQSNTFRASQDPDFKPVIAEFVLYGSLQEIYQRLIGGDEGIIHIYVCMHNNILTNATLNVGRELFSVSESDANHRSLDEHQDCYTRSGTLLFDEVLNDEASIAGSTLSTESQDGRMRITYALLLRSVEEEEFNSTLDNNEDKDPPVNHKAYEWVRESLAHEMKRIEEREKALVLKQKKFEDDAKAKDVEFHAHVKKTQSSLRLMIEQEASKIEHELLDLFETGRRDYKDLENKLHEKISQVEAKERQLESAIANNEASLARRSAELDLKIKLVMEESGHKIEMEKSKLQITQNKIQFLEKELESAVKRGRKAENDIDGLHQQLRSSEEAKLQNEISRLKGRVIELEATITNERCEKERLTSEKENYRISANKLAKMLRHEREAFSSSQGAYETKRKNNDSDQLDELQRIQKELQAL